MASRNSSDSALSESRTDSLPRPCTIRSGRDYWSRQGRRNFGQLVARCCTCPKAVRALRPTRALFPLLGTWPICRAFRMIGREDWNEAHLRSTTKVLETLLLVHCRLDECTAPVCRYQALPAGAFAVLAGGGPGFQPSTRPRRMTSECWTKLATRGLSEPWPYRPSRPSVRALARRRRR